MDTSLLTELHEWENNPEFLNSERKFQDKGEKDIIFDPSNKNHQEYMTGKLFLLKDMRSVHAVAPCDLFLKFESEKRNTFSGEKRP